MASTVDTDLWLQSRRIGVSKGRIAALDEIRLRLIEMSDLPAANEVAARIDGLREDLEHQKHLLVAMQARTAVRRLEHTAAVNTGQRHSNRHA